MPLMRSMNCASVKMPAGSRRPRAPGSANRREHSANVVRLALAAQVVRTGNGTLKLFAWV